MATAAHPDATPATPADEPVEAERGWIRRHALLVVIILVLAATLLAVPRIIHALHYESTDDAFVDASIVSVAPKVADQVVRVLVNDNQQVAAGDVLVELDTRDHAARLEQASAELAAAQAMAKQAEASLALIQKTSSAGVEQASSGVEAARSGVSTAQAETAQAQSFVAQAEAAVATARANLANSRAAVGSAEAEAERANADLQRYTGLPEGVVAKQQIDLAHATARTADASLSAAREAVAAAQARVREAEANANAARSKAEAARTQIGQAQAQVGEASGRLKAADVTPEQIARAEAELASARAAVSQKQAALDAAKLEMNYTKITAPVAGRVTRKSVEPGDYVQVGQQLLSLVPSNVWVVANFKETQLEHMRAGQPVTVVADVLGNLELKAHVDSFQAGTGSRFSLLPPENATGNFVKVVQRVPVKIVFDESPAQLARLAPGMSVEPTVKVR